MPEAADTSTAPAGTAEADATGEFASLLASDERVLVVRRRHWVTFIRAARWFLLVLAAGILVAILDGQVSNNSVSTILDWGLGICLVIGLAGFGWFFLEWQRERYLVTTRRVIEIGGVINKHSRDTSLAMITDMTVSHPWIGRILGYGEIDLLTAAEAGTNKIRYLPDVDGFKRSMLDAKDEHERDIAGAGRAPAAATPSPTSTPATDKLTAEEVDLLGSRSPLQDRIPRPHHRGRVRREEGPDPRPALGKIDPHDRASLSAVCCIDEPFARPDDDASRPRR